MSKFKSDQSVNFTWSALALLAILVVTLSSVTASLASEHGVASAMGQPVSAESTGSVTEVKIDNFAFTPGVITIKAGTQVTWINRDDIPHTVDSTQGKFKSKALDTDDKFSFVFDKPGTYSYFCAVHRHMTGTVVVQPAGR